MSENQMDRFEGMLTQLVSMVGHLREDVEMIKADLNNVKKDVTILKQTQEKQHVEVIGKLELLKADHEITWAKTVENERKIERIKKQIVNN